MGAQRKSSFLGESEGFTEELILEQDLRGWAGVWERSEGRVEHCPDRGKGLVCEAGRTVRGGQNADEGVAREELEKDVAKGILVSQAWRLDPACSVSTQEILKQGVVWLKPPFCSCFIFFPRPTWPVTAGLLPELSRSESSSHTPPCGQL